MTLKYKGEEALALLLMEANIPFRREYQFYNQRKWRFDFAIGNQPLDQKIAIEIEGGVFSNGRHTRGSGYIKDMEKYNHAVLQGWSVLRYATHQVCIDTIDDIRMLINRGQYVKA